MTAQQAPVLTPEEYKRLQLERTLSLKSHDPGDRAAYLIRRMSDWVPAGSKPRVLCVGCRNGHELDHLAAAGSVGSSNTDHHLQSAGASRFFLPPGYREQPGDLTHDLRRDGEPYWAEWRIAESHRYQYHVYRWAAKLIRVNRLTSVLDIGCGVCTKLDAHLGPLVDDLAGVDQASALAIAATRGTCAHLIEADLEQPPADLGRTFDLIVCADVLEHLSDPDGVMRLIVASCHADSLVLLSTPERRRERGRECNASAKPEHVREWADDEFAAFIQSRNFTILRQRLLPKDNARPLPLRHCERAFRRHAADRSPLCCQAVLCRPSGKERP